MVCAFELGKEQEGMEAAEYMGFGSQDVKDFILSQDLESISRSNFLRYPANLCTVISSFFKVNQGSDKFWTLILRIHLSSIQNFIKPKD